MAIGYKRTEQSSIGLFKSAWQRLALIEQARKSMAIALLQYFEDNLQDRLYFIEDRLTYADIVADTAVAAILNLGINLEPYPKVSA